MRVDQVPDRCVNAGLCERFCDECSLPGAVTLLIPMLDDAAATDAEMRAERRDALGALVEDAQEMSPVGVARNRLDLDRFPRKRIGHENSACGPLCHAIAAM